MWKFIEGVKKPPEKRKKTEEEKEECSRSYEATKRQRLFRDEWTRQHTWLYEKDGKMFCSICVEFWDRIRGGVTKNRNVFAVHGCTTMKYESISIHEKCDNHRKCQELRDAKNATPGETKADKIILSLNKDVVSKLEILFRSAHALAINNRPFKDFDWMCTLDTVKGMDLGNTYTNRKAGLEFAHAIAFRVFSFLTRSLTDTFSRLF